MADVREVFRPWFGRVLTIVVAAIASASLVALIVSIGASAIWLAGPWLTFAAGACWTLFWRPVVIVDDGGVRLVNVLRTIDVPWPSITAVDTKWALTLVTAYGSFTGWAAPAPGAHHAVRAMRREAAHLPAGALKGEGIRPGDLPSSASGDAALLVRTRWQQLRDAGHLEDPRLEHDAVPVTWHSGTIVAGAVLLVLAVVGLLV